MSFHIMGTGSCLPARQVTNDELSAFLDTSDEWIVTRTGIHSRPVCTTETLDDLAVTASLRALESAGVEASELDLIVCATCTAERATPAQACVIQQEIGASCPAFDVNGACAGFVFGLDVADGIISAGRARRVLVVSAEKMSRLADWTDRSTAVLFGDGAAAAVLGAGGDSPLYLRTTTEGDRSIIHAWAPAGNSPFDVAKPALAPGAAEEGTFMQMRGREVFKFAVTHIVSEMQRLSASTGIPLDDIDHFVFHQANKRIIDAGIERLGIDPQRAICTIGTTANISSACIPLSLDRLARSGKLRKGDLIAMFGFGSGLVTATCLIRWQPRLAEDGVHGTCIQAADDTEGSKR
jgi:3-oxoacyl-[acyl-carrier-protein] synthase-3